MRRRARPASRESARDPTSPHAQFASTASSAGDCARGRRGSCRGSPSASDLILIRGKPRNSSIFAASSSGARQADRGKRRRPACGGSPQASSATVTPCRRASQSHSARSSAHCAARDGATSCHASLHAASRSATLRTSSAAMKSRARFQLRRSRLPTSRRRRHSATPRRSRRCRRASRRTKTLRTGCLPSAADAEGAARMQFPADAGELHGAIGQESVSTAADFWNRSRPHTHAREPNLHRFHRPLRRRSRHHRCTPTSISPRADAAALHAPHRRHAWRRTGDGCACSRASRKAPRGRRFQDCPIILLPLANPDGYQRGTRYNARGVDLNRNCGFNWRADCEEPPGPGPWSEPENVALRDFILALASGEDRQPALGARRDRRRRRAIHRARAGDVGRARRSEPARPVSAARHRTRPRPAAPAADLRGLPRLARPMVRLRAGISRRHRARR